MTSEVPREAYVRGEFLGCTSDTRSQLVDVTGCGFGLIPVGPPQYMAVGWNTDIVLVFCEGDRLYRISIEEVTDAVPQEAPGEDVPVAHA